MDLMEITEKERLSREDAAARLHVLADALTQGGDRRRQQPETPSRRSVRLGRILVKERALQTPRAAPGHVVTLVGCQTIAPKSRQLPAA